MISEFQGEYRWLSNFWPATVCFEGRYYGAVELAYVAAKTKDESIRSQIQALTCGQAKNFGRTLALRTDWEEVKLLVMATLVFEKFTRHPELMTKLLNTGEQELVEGNTWGDTYWGVCKGVGENNLGKILMGVRKHLKHLA
jgi:ribA/ribD-fused uncharacterized protein